MIDVVDERLAIAAQVLDLSPSDVACHAIDTSFVGLGGTSLRAAELLALFRDELGLSLRIDVLLDDMPLATALAAVAPVDRDSIAEPPTPRPAEASAGQAGMLFAEDLPGGTPFHLLFSIDIQGPLDRGRLVSAIERVCDAHESLRTMFVVGADRRFGVSVNHCRPRVYELPFEDVDQSGADPIASIHQVVAATSRTLLRPFEQPPVVFFLNVVSAERTILTMLIHHAITDGWSIGLLWQQLAATYRGEDPEPSSAMTLTELEYRPGVEELLEERVLDIAGVQTPLTLPSDLTRPPIFDRHGVRLPVVLPPPVRASVERVAAGAGVTRNTVLLAAWSLVVARRSGVDRLLIGLSSAARSSAASRRAVGLGTKLLPVAVDVPPACSVREYLRATARSIARAMAATDVPFERVVSRLAAGGDPTRNPLVQIAFAAHDDLVPERLDFGDGVTGILYEGHCGGTSFDATLFVQRWGEQARLALEYASSVLRPDEAARMGRELRVLLERFDAGLDKQLSSLDWPGDVPTEWAAPAGPSLGDAPDVWAAVSATATANPQRTALVCGASGRELTYEQLIGAVEREAARLSEAGVRAGDRVGIAVPRSPEEIVAVLATVRLGAAYVGLEPDLPATVLADYLAIARPAAVLTGAEPPPALREAAYSGAVLTAADPWDTAGPAHPGPVADPDLERDAYVAFTSGSTGRPKGVRVTHRNILRLIRQPDFLVEGATTRFLRLAPLAFDASTLEIFAPLAGGGAVVTFPDRYVTVESLDAFIPSRRITGLWLTAGLFRLLADHRPTAFRHVVQVLTGGDIVPAEQVRKVLRACGGLVVTNGYGPTENTTFTTTYRMESEADVLDPVPIGRPIRGGGVSVVDSAGRPVPPGAVGELWAWGDGVANGYLDDPEETARRFVGLADGRRCYRTGDLVRWTADGYLQFLGRMDNQVKVRGFRVELDAVRRVLGGMPGVRDAVVAVVGAGAGERRLLAGLVADGNRQRMSEWREYAKRRLPGYAVPSLWVVVDQVPITANGKVDVARLAELANTIGAQPPDVPSSVPTSDEADDQAALKEIEDRIADVWEAVLGTSDFGYDERFFDVGGDSFQLLIVRAELEKAIDGCAVTVMDLFAHPTIKELAAHLRQAAGAAG